MISLPDLPNNELSNRRTTLQSKLVDFGIAGALLHSRVEQYYYAGVAVDGLLWVPFEGESRLLVRRNIPLASSSTDLTDVSSLGSLRNLRGTLSLSDNQKVGIETDLLPYSYVQYLIKLFSPSALKRIDPTLRHIRANKTPYELSQMKLCGKEVATSMDFAAELLKEGMTEIEAATKIDSFLREKGMVNNIPVRAFGQGMASLAYVLSGKNTTYYSTMFSAYTGRGTSLILPLGP